MGINIQMHKKIKEMFQDKKAYVWANLTDDLFLCPLSDCPSAIDEDKIIEIRVFDEEQELRLFSQQEMVVFDSGNYAGYILEHQLIDDNKTQKILGSQHRSKKVCLTLRKYYQYDEDHMAYISYLKLSKIKCLQEDGRGAEEWVKN